MVDAALIARGAEIFHRHHAVLLVGGSHADRAEVAEGITAALYCERGSGVSCGVCAGCKGFHAMRALYVSDIAPDPSHIGIEQIRDAWETSALTSAITLRILRIHGTDRLTKEAATALLKRIEEPSPSLRFILTAPRASHILPTIRSRVAVLSLGIGEPEPGERFHGFQEAVAFATAHGEDRSAIAAALTATLQYVHSAWKHTRDTDNEGSPTVLAKGACLRALAVSIHDMEHTSVNARLSVEHAAAACSFLISKK